MPETDAIVIRNLTKRFGGKTAVDGVNLSVKKGELFALLGVNGAGKTTLIRMLCSLLRPSGGDALLLGKSITKSPGEVRKIIGVSPQETAVAPNLNVRENLELMGGVHGIGRRESLLRMQDMVERLSLQSVLNQRAGTLSGGWQRRLSIAMSLISRPEILFLDEPTLGLDVLARSELWEVVRSLKGSVTVVLTTHYMEEAEQLSDRIGIMRNGRLLCVGTAAECMERAGSDRFEEAFVKIVKGETL